MEFLGAWEWKWNGQPLYTRKASSRGGFWSSKGSELISGSGREVESGYLETIRYPKHFKHFELYQVRCSESLHDVEVVCTSEARWNTIPISRYIEERRLTCWTTLSGSSYSPVSCTGMRTTEVR